VRLWQHYVPSAVKSIAAKAKPAPDAASPRLLGEEWARLSHRSLMPPRAIGIIDHAGGSADLASALCAAAGNVGATARVIDLENPETPKTLDDLDTHVILLPASPDLDLELDTAAAEVAAFFGNRTWWPGVGGAITDCWLVTVTARWLLPTMRRQIRCTRQQVRVSAASAPNTPACGFGTSTWPPDRRHRNRRSRSSGRCTPRASQSSRYATAASTRSGSSRTTPARPRQPTRMRRRLNMRSSSAVREISDRILRALGAPRRTTNHPGKQVGRDTRGRRSTAPDPVGHLNANSRLTVRRG